jgi:hypothetical protein
MEVDALTCLLEHLPDCGLAWRLAILDLAPWRHPTPPAMLHEEDPFIGGIKDPYLDGKTT